MSAIWRCAANLARSATICRSALLFVRQARWFLLGEATRMSFAARMRDLEQEFARAAAVDGDVYLPNFTPSGPVDAVLIGMEPSLGWWARTSSEAAVKIAAGSATSCGRRRISSSTTRLDGTYVQPAAPTTLLTS